MRNNYSMRTEIKLILLSCLVNRSDEDERTLNELLCQKQDWAFITGQLIRHRLNGYFYSSLNEEQKKYIVNKVEQTFGLLCECYKEANKIYLDFFMQLIEKTDDARINIAGLKGVVYNTSIYSLDARMSNDIDVLVCEEDLKIFDEIMRDFGFIQSRDLGITEATKKQKLTQLMNHHDLVPYCKRIQHPIVELIKLDVNFHFDTKDNDITRGIMREGTRNYSGNGYVVRGLMKYTHLLHLCCHFYREASNSIWTSDARDAELYKLVDIQNTIKRFTKEELIKWCEYVKKYNLNKQCYFTLYYLDCFYPSKLYEEIQERIIPGEVQYLNQVVAKGGEVLERDQDFFERTFDMKYGKNFEEKDFTKIF